MPPSSLKKPPRNPTTPDEIELFTGKLQSEVKMYDSLARELSLGNRDAVDVEDIKDWASRNLEQIKKILYTVRRANDDEFASR